MGSLANNEGPSFLKKLSPFFISVALYFLLSIPYETPSILAVIVKCTPIISLMYFIKSSNFENGYPYSNRIVHGLIFCCMGDAFLLWKNCFIYGMLAFTLGHINYMLAFGFRPLKLKLLLITVGPGILVVNILYRGLSGALLIGVPIYILTIGLMIWRVVARIQIKSWKWFQIAACMGSILFAMSDFVIGIDKFVRPVAHSQILIMSLYYAAQLGITLSVLETIRT